MIKSKLYHLDFSVAFISLAFMGIMVLNPETIISASKDALELCASTLVPSIFPFMVVSSVFINYSSQNLFKCFSPVLKILFGTSSPSTGAIICGMLCGYPVGASATCELYKNNMISKSEAESLIAFSNNSGPLFIIGALGLKILNSPKDGTILYIIHIASALICGIFLKPFTHSSKNSLCLSLSVRKKGFTDCICDASLTILKICGFVVAFGVFNSILSPIINLLPVYYKSMISGFLELTNACSIINKGISDYKLRLIFLSGALGWSGMSVHMQVKSIVSPQGISMKKYYAARLFISAISVTISYFVF